MTAQTYDLSAECSITDVDHLRALLLEARRDADDQRSRANRLERELRGEPAPTRWVYALPGDSACSAPHDSRDLALLAAQERFQRAAALQPGGAAETLVSIAPTRPLRPGPTGDAVIEWVVTDLEQGRHAVPEALLTLDSTARADLEYRVATTIEAWRSAHGLPAFVEPDEPKLETWRVSVAADGSHFTCVAGAGR